MVASKRQPEQFTSIAKILVSQFPQIKSVVLNVNPEQTNVILGTECMTICGSDTITDTLCGVKIHAFTAFVLSGKPRSGGGFV